MGACPLKYLEVVCRSINPVRARDFVRIWAEIVDKMIQSYSQAC
jgi:hypothetical protein